MNFKKVDGSRRHNKSTATITITLRAMFVALVFDKYISLFFRNVRFDMYFSFKMLKNTLHNRIFRTEYFATTWIFSCCFLLWMSVMFSSLIGFVFLLLFNLLRLLLLLLPFLVIRSKFLKLPFARVFL